MQKILFSILIVSFYVQFTCRVSSSKVIEPSQKPKIEFEVGQKVYVNSPSGINLRISPSISSQKIDFLHYGVPIMISKIHSEEAFIDGKYKGYWMQNEKGGWFFSFYVSGKPNEKSIKALFHRLLNEFEEFKNLDEPNIELSGDGYRYYYDTQSHVHPEFYSIRFIENYSVEYTLETWFGEGSYKTSASHYFRVCTLDMDLIKRRLKFILEIKADEAISKKQSFKRNSVGGFWAKVCKDVQSKSK